MMIEAKKLGSYMTDQSAPLVNLLQEHIALNLSRAKCLGLFIMSMLNCRTVNMALLCNTMPSRVKSASWYRRMQRFISEISISWRALAVMLVMMTGLEKKTKWVLCLDRTNWKFGKRHINILYLAVSFHGIAIPLFGVF